MGLFGKIKNILFDEEEYTEQIKITPEMRNDDTPSREQIVSAPSKVEKEEKVAPVKEEEKVNTVSERELFNTKSSSPFFDFDEEEFETSKPEKPVEPEPIKDRFMSIPSHPKEPRGYEKTVRTEVRTDYGRYEKTVITETTEKKKFKPSPIISPVYGILHQDYQKEDIVKKSDLDDMDVQKVRDKAFGEKHKEEVKETVTEEVPKPKTTFYEETITIKVPDEEPRTSVKSIDELLNEDTPVANNVIEDEFEDTTIEEPTNDSRNFEKEEVIKEEHVPDMNEDTLESDLFDLIDSMYDTKEEE